MSETAMDGQTFDFIIVGAGSAGAVLAERLSKNAAHQVLLIEAGPPENWMSGMPKGYGKLLTDPGRAYFYPIAHDAKSRGPAEIWARGKMLGGSSAINGMVWIRAGREDYDELERAGNPGWGWETMLPYLRSLEDHQLGASEYRGVGGPIEINTNPHRSPLAEAFIRAGVGMGLKEKDDQNGPELEGVGYAQWNIDRSGRRVSSARGFLTKARGRNNFAVAGHVRVDKVEIIDGRAVGVLGMRDGQAVRYSARREVILSAGALESPRILQLSGIGDGAVLSAAGIKTVRHSPNVGRRMREHLTLALNFRLRNWKDSDNRAYSGLRLAANVLRYATLGSGPMARGAAEAIVFAKVLPNASRADSQIMFNPYSYVKSEKGITFEEEPGMQCYSYYMRPKSQGHVLVQSPDPTAPLLIDANYLDDESDRAGSIAGTRAIRNLMSKSSMRPFVVGETQLTSNAQSDDEILDLYRRFGQSGYHAVGTAAMGPDENAVLDAELKVRGIAGLRVVDCSIFPEIPSGNTNAPAMAAALRAADLIVR